MKKVAVLLFLINFSISKSQNSRENRQAFTLEIAANETQQYKAEINEGPFFVHDKILQIYCGETVFIECEITGDSISKMKVVSKNLNPNKTIEIEFTQDSKDRKKITTMLELKNPFERELIYEASMLTPRNKQWRETSIIPIAAKLSSYEIWPHPIVSLALTKWKLK
jgi:hypothetical protein